MINSLRSSYRFIIKSRSYTIINLSGLVIGLTISFYLLTFSINESSYNTFIPGHESIFRWIYQDNQGIRTSFTPYLLADTLNHYREEYPEQCRFALLQGIIGTVRVQRENSFQEEKEFYTADPSFFRLFGIPFTSLDGTKPLMEPEDLAISESNAIKYFGTADPGIREIRIDVQGLAFDLRITTVFKDLPWNSTIHPGFIASNGFLVRLFQTIDSSLLKDLMSKSGLFVETYSRITGNKSGDFSGSIDLIGKATGITLDGPSLILQPVGDIYLHSDKIAYNFHQQGDRESILIYTSLAFVVLLLAGINYSILSTARSALRYKEVGVRKILGASRQDLQFQILAESTLLTFIAFPLAMLLMGLLEPLMEYLEITEIRIHQQNLLKYLLIFGGITLFIGLLSGMYIAIFLGSMKPLEAIKAKLYPHKRFNLSKVFIIIQLTITTGLLIGILTISRQIWFCHNRNPGFDPSSILLVNIGNCPNDVSRALKNKISGLPGVVNISAASFSLPSEGLAIKPLSLPDMKDPLSCEVMQIDERYFQTLGVPFIRGREFSSIQDSGKTDRIIINKTLQEAIAQKVSNTNLIGDWNVIGVVEDIQVHSLRHGVSPTIFFYAPGDVLTMIVRHLPDSAEVVTQRIEEIMKLFFPGVQPDVSRFDHSLAKIYREDRNFGIIVGIMTFLSIVVTAMGLFGLAILLSERKTREIAIRKVFGASNNQIMYYMQKEFVYFTGIAALISIPSAWFIMSAWLDTFHYHVSPGWYMYIVSVAGVVFFVSGILYWRMRIILQMNPVDALKYD